MRSYLEKHCRPHLCPTNDSWRVDETYVKIKGKDRYLYRAVDSTGRNLDFLLAAKRDAQAAIRFLCKAMKAVHNSHRVLKQSLLSDIFAVLKCCRALVDSLLLFRS